MEEEVKELLIEYLESEDYTYHIKPNKIIHNCLSDEHEDNNASAFTSLVEDNIFCSCSSCGFYLNESSLLNFLGIGELSQEDKLKRKLSKIRKTRKEMESNEVASETSKAKKIFLPPQAKLFSSMLKEETYRGISKSTFDFVEAYITPKENYYSKRIIFPMYNYKNELVSFEAVATGKLPPLIIKGKEVEAPKILRPSGLNDDYFGFENLIGQNQKCKKLCIICEGLFSALSLIEIGYNGLINFGVGCNIEKISGLLDKGVTHILVMGDKDKSGFALNGKYIKMLRKSFNVRFFRHSYLAGEKYDANDYLKEGEGVLERLIEKNIKGWYYD